MERNSGGSRNFKYKYTYNSGENSSKDGKNTDWGEWIPIAILFCIPTLVTRLIAVIWGVSKVRRLVVSQKKKYDEAARRAGEALRRTSSSKTQEEGRLGTGLLVGGAVVAAIFTLGTLSSLATFVESLWYGSFFADELVDVLVCAALCVGGFVLLGTGLGLRRRQSRYVSYLGYIGANRQVSLPPMAASLHVSVGRLSRDLQGMLEKKILPTGYLDLREGKLYLTEMGAAQPKEEEPRPEPQSKSQSEGSEEDELLRQIRLVNDLIPDPVISEKIDRIEEITQKILQYQKTHPNRTQQLRTFLNYYLPTTLKILQSYARLDAQGVEGENISGAKERIEGMMDQVVAGFETQLDKLFHDDAMDIAADVQVLENMLKKDGLSQDSLKME